MLFFVKYGDQEHQVRIESREDRLFVRYGDEPEEELDLTFYGHNCTYIRNTKTFSANVVGGKGEYTVWRPRGNVSLFVESEYRRIVSRLRGMTSGDENKVTAKMPGKMVKVLVKAGDNVTQGQTVMVMEAMKMENEIRVSKDGKVKTVFVSEGQVVESGDGLLELES